MAGWLKPWLIVPIAFGLLAATKVWLSYLRYDLSIETQQLVAEKQAIGMESTKLRIEIASLTRPERLRQMAVSELGMAPPSPAQVVHP